MKKLLSTTALVFALGFPALVLAETAKPAADQAAAPAADTAKQQQNNGMSGFLAERGQSDVFASDLIGHDVHARRAPADMTLTDGQATMNANGTHGMAMMNLADLDQMDNIGQINEIVLSSDGQVRAIVIGVGGFLGAGEQDIAVTMDQVTFASDPDDSSQMYIVVNTGADMLKEAPAYQRTVERTDAATADKTNETTMAKTDTATGDAKPRAERRAFAAPDIQREGYRRVEVTEVSSEILIGESVYDVNDNDLGTVTDIIIDDAGTVTNVIIDFGGFLGIGTSQASIQFDELTILSTESLDDVLLYVDATKEQIQDLPQYEAKI